ncbi:MAG: response regulator transcription factor [Actinobacteria bacterium]|nr:response regulator transcription factor [Actinomycetota bacterium]
MSAPAVPLRVVIVDDHAVIRAGLRLLLQRQDGIEPVAEGVSGADAINRARELQPDVVLLDLSMPNESGIDAIPKILEVSPASRIVMLSMHDDPDYVRGAFAAGASGYVLKEAADTELVSAIRDVAAGGSHLDPALRARIAAAGKAEAVEARPLSQREIEVTRLLALGHTNLEIAERLSISVRTAETHRAHVMRKLGLRSRAELVRYALAHGLLDGR